MYIYTHVHTYIHICLHKHIRLHTHINAYLYMRSHKNRYLDGGADLIAPLDNGILATAAIQQDRVVLCMCVCVHVCMEVHVCVCVFVYVHVYWNACMYYVFAPATPHAPKHEQLNITSRITNTQGPRHKNNSSDCRDRGN